MHRLQVGGLVVEHAVLGCFDAGQQPHHRRAQLVRQVGDVLLAQLLLALQRLGEAVERPADGVDLVVAGGIDARVEVAGLHLLGRYSDAAQRPRQRQGEVERDDKGAGGRDGARDEVQAA